MPASRAGAFGVPDHLADASTNAGGASGFLSSMSKSVPPPMDVMRSIGGVQMPEYWGTLEGAGKDQSSATGPGTPKIRPRA